jgi:hypothetical protein
MSESTRKLSPETLRLIAILNALATDSILEGLTSLATGDTFSFDAPISVILDGHLIRGRLAKPEVFASLVDERLKAIAETATFHLSGDATPETEVQTRRVLVESLSDGFGKNLRAARKREHRAMEMFERTWGAQDELDENGRPTIDDLSDADALLALETQSPRVTLTLANAELFVPPGRWDPIGLMRISVRHIAGWWIPPIP